MYSVCVCVCVWGGGGGGGCKGEHFLLNLQHRKQTTYCMYTYYQYFCATLKGHRPYISTLHSYPPTTLDNSMYMPLATVSHT